MIRRRVSESSDRVRFDVAKAHLISVKADVPRVRFDAVALW